MTIVPSTLDDIPALVDLIETCFNGEESRKGWTTRIDFIGGSRVTPATMKRDMEKPGTVILKYLDNDDKIVGCAFTEKRADKLYTGMLCVRPDLQATGMGRKIMGAVEDMAKLYNCTHMSICVIDKRTELIGWYERQGFKRTGEATPFPGKDGCGTAKVSAQIIYLEKAI